MIDPLVSVIMPAYNAQEFIAESIASVQKQYYSRWQLIVVDDGSTDKTQSIIASYMKNDSRIHYVYQERGGQGKARNTGIKVATGCYIAFLDADDLWTSDKLAVQAEYLDNNRRTDVVFSQGYKLSGKESKNFDTVIRNRWDFRFVNSFLENNPVPIPSVMARKIALQRVAYFDERPDLQNAEDYHLWLKLLLDNICYTLVSNLIGLLV
ncbi:MAG: glycosyltransferase family 2 protein [Chryseobacterium sp.]|nr:MAG: glycosyltransferase family 2 protein [Chryseobacterium sp.]